MALISRLRANGKPKLSKGPTPAKIIHACKRGAILRLHFGGRMRRAFTLDCAPVERKYAARAIRSGQLQPDRDALFPGMSQCWVWREPDPDRPP